MNIHISSACNGCLYHEFPYNATPPIAKSGEKYFNSMDDVYEIIGLLINEAEEWNKQGKNFNVALSVTKQLPFFCCPNKVLSREKQKVIERYIYCNETGTKAFNGCYGEQPYKWLQQYFIIKQALALKEREQINKNKKK